MPLGQGCTQSYSSQINMNLIEGRLGGQKVCMRVPWSWDVYPAEEGLHFPNSFDRSTGYWTSANTTALFELHDHSRYQLYRASPTFSLGNNNHSSLSYVSKFCLLNFSLWFWIQTERIRNHESNQWLGDYLHYCY